MRQVCCSCGILYGIKPPLEDDSETHGFCLECFDGELEKIKLYQKDGTDRSNKVDPENQI